MIDVREEEVGICGLFSYMRKEDGERWGLCIGMSGF